MTLARCVEGEVQSGGGGRRHFQKYFKIKSSFQLTRINDFAWLQLSLAAQPLKT